MGQLVWTFGSGTEFQSARAGFRLIAGPAPAGQGYRYAVLARDTDDAAPLASGSRESLREAIEAAEQAVGAIDPPHSRAA